MKITRIVIFGGLLVGALGIGLVLFLLDQAYREPVNFDLVEPGLYLGGSVKTPPPGAKAVLNLCETEDPYQCEIHRWMPIRDGEPAPSLDWLGKQVDFIDRQRKAGRTTFVHCLNGASRGPTVVAAYLMKEKRWTRDEALAYLRERRQVVRPNPAFMELLGQWEQVLNKP